MSEAGDEVGWVGLNEHPLDQALSFSGNPNGPLGLEGLRRKAGEFRNREERGERFIIYIYMKINMTPKI